MSGPTSLKTYATDRGMSRGDLASHLGLSEGFVSLLIAGKRHAGIAVALRIEQRTKGAVKALSLVSPAERRTLLAARRVPRVPRDSSSKPSEN
jgi:DNA-binding transcriptional regulator YdaS (Cro superfamily)